MEGAKGNLGCLSEMGGRGRGGPGVPERDAGQGPRGPCIRGSPGAAWAQSACCCHTPGSRPQGTIVRQRVSTWDPVAKEPGPGHMVGWGGWARLWLGRGGQGRPWACSQPLCVLGSWDPRRSLAGHLWGGVCLVPRWTH